MASIRDLGQFDNTLVNNIAGDHCANAEEAVRGELLGRERPIENWLFVDFRRLAEIDRHIDEDFGSLVGAVVNRVNGPTRRMVSTASSYDLSGRHAVRPQFRARGACRDRVWQATCPKDLQRWLNTKCST